MNAAPSPSDSTLPRPPTWPRSAQLALAFLLGVAATLLAVNIWQSVQWSTNPTEILSTDSQLPRPRPQPGPTSHGTTLPGHRGETAAPARGKPTPAEKSIDINTADEAGLMRLPGIGPALASRIVEERDKGLFRSVDDLDRVPGIGPKTVAKLRPYATASSVASARPAD